MKNKIIFLFFCLSTLTFAQNMDDYELLVCFRDDINIRKGPGTNFEKISYKKLSYGELLYVVEEKDGWVKFRFTSEDNGYHVWALKKLIESPRKYEHYTGPEKKVTELEWELTQANIKLAKFDIDVTFDNSARIFKAVKFLGTDQVNNRTTIKLRELLITSCNLAKSIIGYQFPEFKERGNKDFEMKFWLNLEGYEYIALYKDGNLSFNEQYYQFMKESGSNY